MESSLLSIKESNGNRPRRHWERICSGPVYEGFIKILVRQQEQPDHNQAMAAITLRQGALATSGDARRSIMIEGKRYGHILNPQTGWPVPDAPRSITVLSSTCVQAGTLATIAMLQGEGAEDFLEQAETQSWCVR